MAVTRNKSARNGWLFVKTLSSASFPKTITGTSSTIQSRKKTAKHPHCIMNAVFINAQHRRNRGGICGKIYGNGFEAFFCCNRQLAVSSMGLFIVLSSVGSLNTISFSIAKSGKD